MRKTLDFLTVIAVAIAVFYIILFIATFVQARERYKIRRVYYTMPSHRTILHVTHFKRQPVVYPIRHGNRLWAYPTRSVLVPNYTRYYRPQVRSVCPM